MPLPTRIKVSVRDVWTKPDSELQQCFGDLSKLIGYPVAIEPEWELLWGELQPNFPDPGTFVPYIAGIVRAWAVSLMELAENDGNSDWTEELLEELKQTHRLKIQIDVDDSKPSTRWSRKLRAFEISLSKKAPSDKSAVVARMHDSLLSAFKEQTESRLPDRSVAPSEEWGKIDSSDLETASIFTPTATDRISVSKPSLDKLPDVSGLERPEFLFRKPPYLLSVQQYAYGKEISVQCSHQPSLELIGEYFKRWCKKNHNLTTKPPAAKITMRECAFGLGLIQDQLRMEVDDRNYQHHLGPTMILSFIEGVLGYRMIYQDASTWTFRRDVGFQ